MRNSEQSDLKSVEVPSTRGVASASAPVVGKRSDWTEAHSGEKARSDDDYALRVTDRSDVQDLSDAGVER